jgi:hypothetical protein
MLLALLGLTNGEITIAAQNFDSTMDSSILPIMVQIGLQQ